MSDRPAAHPARVALVTGGTRGIGRAIADRLRSDGLRVIAAARTVEGEADIEADLARPGAGRELVRTVVEREGRLDVLVNNAGLQRVGSVEAVPVEAWNAMVAVHMTAPFEATREALPAMRANAFGRIVNVASVHGLIGSAEKAPYTATKHGLVGLTKAVALETAGEPITCNAVCPGFVRTALIDDQIAALMERDGLAREAAERALLGPRQPSEHLIEPSAVAALVGYLCSESAADVTGAALPIDGAWTAR